MYKIPFFTILITILLLLFPAAGAFAEDEIVTIEIVDEDTDEIEIISDDEILLPEVEIVETSEPATTALTGEEAVEHSEFTLDESLKRAAGIVIEQAAKGHARFKMRGYEMDMIGFLIDGIPIYDIYKNNIDISQIPIFSYSEISIQRGASSALYGSDAAVGVVELDSGMPETGSIRTGLSFDLSNSDLLNDSYSASDADEFNTGLTAYALAEDILDDFYYKVGGAYYDNGGFTPSAALTTEVKKEWLEEILNPSVYGTGLASILSSDSSMLDYVAHDDSWEDTFSKGFNFTGKTGVFIGDNAETGVSAAFNYNQKNSVSFDCDYLSGWDEGYEVWMNGDDPADGFTERDYEWPYMYDWYVTPYYEQQLDSLFLKANIYYRVLANSLIWSGSYSNWYETSWGGRISADWDIVEWNSLSTALIFRNDDHTESETYYTMPSPTALSDYLGGVCPDDEDVPETVIVKQLAGLQAALAVEDKLTLSMFEITAGCSYDVQYFYKSLGEAGYWRENDDGTWYYELKTNSISSSTAMLLGTRDSLNPSLNIDINFNPDVFTLNIGSSIKTRFPSFDNYYSDYYEMDDELFCEELDNQVSYNFNLGAEYIILPENLSVRCDVFYTRYTNKLEDYINSDGDTTYFNIPEADSYGIEALCFFEAEIPAVILFSGSLGYTFNLGSNIDQADSIFTYNPSHEVLFDIQAETLYELPSKLMIWGRFSTGAVAYTMSELPDSDADYPGDYLTTVALHSPLYLNAKIIQRMPFGCSMYFLIENILDDYSIDPFNPGAGRTFSIGLDFDTFDL